MACLSRLDSLWYGKEPVRPASREAAYDRTLIWSLERRWIKSLDQRNRDDFRCKLQEGWASLAEHEVPMPVVKECARRVDRMLSLTAGCKGMTEGSSPGMSFTRICLYGCSPIWTGTGFRGTEQASFGRDTPRSTRHWSISAGTTARK
ncbi:hypothetical protein N6H14_25875 [Paenibacillus sp. CC-CFT747]|nr:hypothetical protein N6H14_25875 [Paenibacillus sp. CC-CFT747]